VVVVNANLYVQKCCLKEKKLGTVSRICASNKILTRSELKVCRVMDPVTACTRPACLRSSSSCWDLKSAESLEFRTECNPCSWAGRAALCTCRKLHSLLCWERES